MTQQRRTSLKELQKLDIAIYEARQRIQTFDGLFEELEEPSLRIESDLGTSRTRVKDMKLEEARLELSIAEKKERLKRLQEKAGSVRNLREEAAVSAELDMVKRALQNDEHEAFALLDQVGKGEDRLGELEAAHRLASEELEPKRAALLAERDGARAALEGMSKERDAYAKAMDPSEVKVYDAIRGGSRRAAVSEITHDGACGNCFGVVPLQIQNEIRHGESLIRCEACGVIIAAPELVEEEVAHAAIAKPKADEGTDGASDEDEEEEE